MSSRSPSTLVLLLAAAVAAAACDGGSERPAGAGTAPEVEGSALITGAAPDRWSLLTVPREGGVARARALDDPARVVWEGRTRLPPAREVRLVEGPVVLLVDRDGTLRRYDPRADRLSRVGDVAEGARWTGWDRYGLWVEAERSGLLEVGPEGSWRFELGARPRWATPVAEGKVAALVEEGEGGSLWLVDRGGSEPQARARDGFATPGLVTAWGRRLALSTDGDVRFYAVPSLTASGAVSVGGPITAMAASPSSHELYVAVDDPPRLMRVERFGMRAHEMTALPRAARAVRPSVLGGSVLVHDGGAPLRVPVGGGDTVRTAGAWRDDLPLALPDGRVVVPREDGGAALWSRGGGAEPLDGSGDRHWAAVRWNPAPPPVVADRVSGEAAADSPGTAPAASDTAPTVAAGAPTAEPGTAAPDTAGEPPPPGFYAVVVAAREPAGVRDLLGRLEEAGYPVALQLHRDDAGRTWHRGLVGPYDERTGAEAAARQLQRERGTSAWVTELRAGATTEEIFR